MASCQSESIFSTNLHCFPSSGCKYVQNQLELCWEPGQCLHILFLPLLEWSSPSILTISLITFLNIFTQKSPPSEAFPDHPFQKFNPFLPILYSPSLLHIFFLLSTFHCITFIIFYLFIFYCMSTSIVGTLWEIRIFFLLHYPQSLEQYVTWNR